MFLVIIQRPVRAEWQSVQFSPDRVSATFSADDK
jgi:hypothetical protein